LLGPCDRGNPCPCPGGRAGRAGAEGKRRAYQALLLEEGGKARAADVIEGGRHPIGAKEVGENLASGVAFSNAVVDPFAHLGLTHLPMPHTAVRLWRVCHEHGLTGPAMAAE
jgi:hypothetical protein